MMDLLALGFSGLVENLLEAREGRRQTRSKFRQKEEVILLGKMLPLLLYSTERGLGHCNWTLGCLEGSSGVKHTQCTLHILGKSPRDHSAGPMALVPRAGQFFKHP